MYISFLLPFIPSQCIVIDHSWPRCSLNLKNYMLLGPILCLFWNLTSSFITELECDRYIDSLWAVACSFCLSLWLVGWATPRSDYRMVLFMTRGCITLNFSFRQDFVTFSLRNSSSSAAMQSKGARAWASTYLPQASLRWKQLSFQWFLSCWAWSSRSQVSYRVCTSCLLRVISTSMTCLSCLGSFSLREAKSWSASTGCMLLLLIQFNDGVGGGYLIFAALIDINLMEREEEETLSTPGVIEKFQTAAKIANEVLAKLLKKLAVGSKTFDLCLWADNLIYEELSKVYNKKPTFKGLAFPTCLSVNEVCGHHSPLQEDSTTVKEGDVVKAELGVHVDGFPALVAHTVVVRSDKSAPVGGKKADVILAAYKAAQASLRLIKPGHFNRDVTEVIEKVCGDYEVNPLEGVLSHQIKKHLIDGNKVIINKENYDQSVEKSEFAVHDVFALDVFVSSGEGKPKEADVRCTVYKRALDRTYNLKIKQSRQFFNEVAERYPSFCFSINGFEDLIGARLGVKQCMEHELLVPYPVLAEKPGEVVAQFKLTVMITKGKTTALTGLPLDEAEFKADHELKNPHVVELLAMSMDKAEQKKAKKKKESAPQ